MNKFISRVVARSVCKFIIKILLHMYFSMILIEHFGNTYISELHPIAAFFIRVILSQLLPDVL